MQRQEPHWLLNDADAQRYGAALSNALRHFPVEKSQKAIDIGALLFCAFQFEAPRIALSMQQAKMRRQRPAAPTPASMGATVYQFTQPNNQRPQGPPHSQAQPAPVQASGVEAAPPMAEPPQPGDFGLGGEDFGLH